MPRSKPTFCHTLLLQRSNEKETFERSIEKHCLVGKRCGSWVTNIPGQCPVCKSQPLGFARFGAVLGCGHVHLTTHYNRKLSKPKVRDIVKNRITSLFSLGLKAKILMVNDNNNDDEDDEGLYHLVNH
ncbi:hypothetical protein STEG23_016635 [Scotinomys teguina]